MAKQLLITADDFGVHDVIDKGIFQCIKAGSIDCVDVIVTHHSSGRRIRKLMKLIEEKKLNIKVGLHLSLTCGSPLYLGDPGYLSTVARLNAKGEQIFKFVQSKKMVERIAGLGKKHEKALGEEIKAQYKEFERITDKKPYHISSHVGVFNATKDLYRILVDFALLKKVPIRCPVFIGLEANKKIWRRNPKPKMIPFSFKFLALIDKEPRGMLSWLKKKVRPIFNDDMGNGLKSTKYFIEHFYKQGSPGNLRIILNDIVRTGAGTYEMVVHPVSYEDKKEFYGMPPGIKRDTLSHRRTETKTLCDKMDVRNELKIRNIKKFKF